MLNFIPSPDEIREEIKEDLVRDLRCEIKKGKEEIKRLKKLTAAYEAALKIAEGMT